MTTYYDVPPVGEQEFANPNFEAWLNAELQKREQANKQIYKNAQVKDQQLGNLIAEVYGNPSAFSKYWRRTKVPTPPDLKRRAKKVWRKFAQWQEAERQHAYRREYRQRRAQANEILQDEGYVPGEHYAPTRAITFAKEVLNPAQSGVRMLPPGEEGVQS